MPVPIPGLKVGSDTQKVKFMMIFGRPKTKIFQEFRNVPGRAPLPTNHVGKAGTEFRHVVLPKGSWLFEAPRFREL